MASAIGAGDEPHLQRDAKAVEDRRIEVAALRVGAEEMRVAVLADEARRAPGVRERQVREVVGVLRRDQGRDDDGDDDADDDGERRDGDAALAELGPEGGQRLGVHAAPRRRRGSSSA